MGNYATALADFDHAIELEPNNDWTLYHRAILSQILNREESAQSDLRAAIALSRQMYEDNERAWQNTFNLILYSLAAGITEEAARIQAETLAASPSSSSLVEAMKDLDDFLALFPHHALALVLRQRLAHHLSSTDPIGSR